MHCVAILTYNNASFFELGCAVELFALPRPEQENWYSSEIVSFEGGALTLAVGMQMQVKCISSLEAFDILIVPSWPVSNKTPCALLAREVSTFIQAGKRIYSFCSGAFLLAELGLLTNKKATTHWKYAQLFQQKYPDIEYQDDVLYLYDKQIGTSAGSAAALDLGIEIIRQDYGYQVANQIARQLVLSAHRSGGQSQFVQTPMLNAPGQFAKSLDWAVEHLNQNIDINSFAARASMSRRTFDRKFKSTFNLTPKDWLTLQRINLAKNILETQSSSIDRVAELSGFNNAITMRHHFRKQLGVSPKSYRSQFSAR
ncbi:MAG: helix-turn-helix domain-containing protein [Pseudomonadales bacterium]|nr:helix-turn-helix domain-containing protein [Pseudomonadales bacterium]NRA17774.1 helix-turn-helix domain-containing protein [Oceanospirillaceae bacterium]